MKLLMLLLLAGVLRAEEVSLETAKQYHGDTYSSYEVAGDTITKIYIDNREGHCCPRLGQEPVMDRSEFDMVAKVYNWSQAALGKGHKIININIENTRWNGKNFWVEFSGFSEKFPSTVEAWPDRQCCLAGETNADGSNITANNRDSELMGLSTTAKVKVTKWRTKYSIDEYEDFLNSIKVQSAFVDKFGHLHYLAAEVEEKIVYDKDSYLATFDSRKVRQVWSSEAAKVFKDYAAKNDLCSTDIVAMHLYKNWLVIHTDCDKATSPGPMPNYFFKRIRGKWVLVWDDFSFAERTSIHEEDIPKRLRDL